MPPLTARPKRTTSVDHSLLSHRYIGRGTGVGEILAFEALSNSMTAAIK
jgi:hypothetical protein